MIISFKEKIGDYIIIKSGEIIVNKDSLITIEISDEGGEPLLLKIEFLNQGGRIASISQEVNETTQTLKFLNFEQDNMVNGLFEPVEIGTLDENGQIHTLYFNCLIHTISSKDGNRIFKYSFLIKE